MQELIQTPLPGTFSTPESVPENSVPGIDRSKPETPSWLETIDLGVTEGGRPLTAFGFGNGPLKVSLMAGAHADEPVGPELLRTLVRSVAGCSTGTPGIFDRWTFFVVPHVNPDGEAANRKWIKEWPSLEAYVDGAVRELPGRDVEFAWPDRRQENTLIGDWLRSQGPFDLHASLHGMGFSDGAMLLIERNWTYRTEGMQRRFRLDAAREGLKMHDHNRKGEKGFFHIAPGFTTTPEGAAMRTYFQSHEDADMALKFGNSSMEFVRSLGGDPLCIVTELPLFLVKGASEPGIPTAYLAFKKELPDIRKQVAEGGSIEHWRNLYGLEPVPLESALRLQARAVGAAMDTVEAAQVAGYPNNQRTT